MTEYYVRNEESIRMLSGLSITHFLWVGDRTWASTLPARAGARSEVPSHAACWKRLTGMPREH